MFFLGAFLLGVGAFAAWNVQQQQRVSSELIAREVRGMLAIEELHMEMREIRYQLNLFLRTHEITHLRNIIQVHSHADDLLRKALSLARTPLEKHRINIVSDGYNSFFQGFQSISEQLIPQELANNAREQEPQNTPGRNDTRNAASTDPSGDKIAIATPLIEQLSQLSDVLMTEQVLEPLAQCIEVNSQVVELTNEASEDAARHLTIGFLLLGLCGGVAGILMGVGVGRAIGKSIVQLNVSIRGASSRLSDLRGAVTVTHRGDLAGLEVGVKELEEDVAQVVEQLQQRERELLRSEQLARVGQLAAGLAHEFRNPLMPMKMLVQNAIERGDEVGLKGRSLQILNEEISRLEQSIQSFLDFARPPVPERCQEDLVEIVRNTTFLVRGRCEQQMIDLQVEVPDTPVIANVDRTQIRQLLLNLILNSLDALKNRGTIHVQVDPNALLPAQAIANESPSTLADTEELISEHQALRVGVRKNIANPRPCFMIRVSDNGMGIPLEMLDRIFEPFVTSKETGTGLGLSICKRIADMHRGFLVAANRAGGGAEFSFYLPQDTNVPK